MVSSLKQKPAPFRGGMLITRFHPDLIDLRSSPAAANGAESFSLLGLALWGSGSQGVFTGFTLGGVSALLPFPVRFYQILVLIFAFFCIQYLYAV
jgi:hypothetical protein